METGYIKLTELAGMLQVVQQTSFRMVLLNKEGQWVLHTLIVEVLPEEVRVKSPSFCYDYGSVTFIAGMKPGMDIASWLLNKQGKIDNYDFQYAFQQDVTQSTCYWERQPSYTSGRLPKIAYPFTSYNLPQASNAWGLPPGILVNDRYPFFQSAQYAIAWLIYEVTDPNQLGASDQAFLIRYIHDEARIEHIEISPLVLSIAVDGTNLTNVQLQISNTLETVAYEDITQGRQIDYPLPNGLPPELWIALVRSNDWLDYTYLSQRWSPFGQRQKQSNISYTPPNIRTQIQELIAQGEGLMVEFKREIPPEHDKMLKTVAAFANGYGGVILLGVTNDGDVVGIKPIGDINKEKDRITNMIRDTVSPDPEIRMEHCDMDGKGTFVIAIFVDKGTSPLYGLHYDKLEVYVRRQATTFRAHPEEIAAIVQANQPAMRYSL